MDIEQLIAAIHGPYFKRQVVVKTQQLEACKAALGSAAIEIDQTISVDDERTLLILKHRKPKAPEKREPTPVPQPHHFGYPQYPFNVPAGRRDHLSPSETGTWSMTNPFGTTGPINYHDQAVLALMNSVPASWLNEEEVNALYDFMTRYALRVFSSKQNQYIALQDPKGRDATFLKAVANGSYLSQGRGPVLLSPSFSIKSITLVPTPPEAGPVETVRVEWY